MSSAQLSALKCELSNEHKEPAEVAPLPSPPHSLDLNRASPLSPALYFLASPIVQANSLVPSSNLKIAGICAIVIDLSNVHDCLVPLAKHFAASITKVGNGTITTQVSVYALHNPKYNVAHAKSSLPESCQQQASETRLSSYTPGLLSIEFQCKDVVKGGGMDFEIGHLASTLLLPPQSVPRIIIASRTQALSQFVSIAKKYNCALSLVTGWEEMLSALNNAF
jgi:hypothetical protein